ncbi:MAG: alpha/beta hydrolase [Alphaproteobacteria bacterium]|nr:alpha/beta hydrolase [Alphaproteobacteria bacterium]
MRVAFTEIDGVQTRYYHEGSGHERTLVLLHGLGIAADSWIRNVDPLAKHFRIIAPDLLGHGFTGFPGLNGQAAHPLMVRHVLGLLDRLGVDRFSVCGHSYGATIATLLYFERPAKVERLILNGSHRIFQAPDDTVVGFDKSFANAMSALRNPSLETCRQRLINVCYDANNIPEEILLPQLTSYAQPGMADSYEAIARANFDNGLSRPFRCGDRIHQVTIPVLAMSGRDDVRVPVKDLEAGIKKLRNGKLVLVDRCGHMLQGEHADFFNRTVIEFMNGDLA